MKNFFNSFVFVTPSIVRSSMQRIIFFDGVCNLCDSVVSKVFKIDKNHKFLFASLQSETALKLLKKQDFEKDTIVYFVDGQAYYYSNAAAKILLDLGGFYAALATIIMALPEFLRDWIYREIASNRYRIFGQKIECRVPDETEKAYFLP